MATAWVCVWLERALVASPADAADAADESIVDSPGGPDGTLRLAGPSRGFLEPEPAGRLARSSSWIDRLQIRLHPTNRLLPMVCT
jgi:hypothetical protein